jgi:L-serine dehydratase
MNISIFDMFSIGIGPSSSHTVGPMRAALAFLQSLPQLDAVHRVEITLYGSLAFTGKGHGTDKAIMAGLSGAAPETIDPDNIDPLIADIEETQKIKLLNKHVISFSAQKDIVFDYKKTLDYHPNGMQFKAFSDDKLLAEAIYFSIGGGFIVNQEDINRPATSPENLPYPFNTAAELMQHCQHHQLTIAQVMMANEKAWRDEATIKARLLKIADVMEKCIEKGCQASGVLPGPLQVRRRAPALYQKLIKEGPPSATHPQIMNWLNVYALAVNEQNAAGGRVVTAPTNGAAGIVPAVLNYYKYFCAGANEKGVMDYLLTAGAIAILYKKNASISGAEMGCQGEVGVACSMAAGALAAVLGGTIFQVESAAEIGMEHNLGLTCDPVGGLVQIPCIERNAMGTVKAVNAAKLALAEDGQHKVSLDMVINTMREIGRNMNSIYKETAKGGLAVAVNVIEC